MTTADRPPAEGLPADSSPAGRPPADRPPADSTPMDGSAEERSVDVRPDLAPAGDPAADPSSSPPVVRLLVVDADRRVRASLAGLLDLADQVQVVGSAGHARAALDQCEACRPDAVVVDPRLPELPEGIDFIRGLRAHRPDVRVVVVAWGPALANTFGDDAGVAVVQADGGDLADRIVEALRPTGAAERPTGRDRAAGASVDARLEATA